MSIEKMFLIPTVGNRISELQKMLLSMQRYKKGWKFVIIAQAYSNSEKMELSDFVKTIGLDADIVFLKDGVGPARARRVAISSFDADAWIGLDDDMIITPETDYNKMVDIIMDRKDIGLLSSNWARTAELVKERGTKEKLVKQPIVYTGGGLAFRRDFVEMFLEKSPDELWLFDNIAWSLTSYLNGYENYRYLGSICVHKACTKGGRREWVYQGSRVLPDKAFINVRPASNNKRELELGNCWHICDSSDLTEKAKQIHKEAKERLTAK